MFLYVFGFNNALTLVRHLSEKGTEGTVEERKEIQRRLREMRMTLEKQKKYNMHPQNPLPPPPLTPPAESTAGLYHTKATKRMPDSFAIIINPFKPRVP